MENLIKYIRELPEGSTIEIIDEENHPLDWYAQESEDFDGRKDVKIVIPHNIPKNRMISMLDTKILEGIDIFARRWEEYKEDFYKFACEKSDDDRWQDPGFRNHMYDQYINTDRTITSRWYGLDKDNQRTLLRYINEVLTHGLSHHYFDSGVVFVTIEPDESKG